MMGQQPRMESLFYYFRLEDQIPEDHLLRLLDHHVDLRAGGPPYTTAISAGYTPIHKLGLCVPHSRPEWVLRSRVGSLPTTRKRAFSSSSLY